MNKYTCYGCGAVVESTSYCENCADKIRIQLEAARVFADEHKEEIQRLRETFGLNDPEPVHGAYVRMPIIRN